MLLTFKYLVTRGKSHKIPFPIIVPLSNYNFIPLDLLFTPSRVVLKVGVMTPLECHDLMSGESQYARHCQLVPLSHDRRDIPQARCACNLRDAAAASKLRLPPPCDPEEKACPPPLAAVALCRKTSPTGTGREWEIATGGVQLLGEG